MSVAFQLPPRCLDHQRTHYVGGGALCSARGVVRVTSIGRKQRVTRRELSLRHACVLFGWQRQKQPGSFRRQAYLDWRRSILIRAHPVQNIFRRAAAFFEYTRCKTSWTVPFTGVPQARRMKWWPWLPRAPRQLNHSARPRASSSRSPRTFKPCPRTPLLARARAHRTLAGMTPPLPREWLWRSRPSPQLPSPSTAVSRSLSRRSTLPSSRPESTAQAFRGQRTLPSSTRSTCRVSCQSCAMRAVKV